MSRAHLIEHYVFRNSHYYVTYKEKDEFAVKCFPIKKENPFQQFGEVIREYCMYRIAGGLGVGP